MPRPSNTATATVEAIAPAITLNDGENPPAIETPAIEVPTITPEQAMEALAAHYKLPSASEVHKALTGWAKVTRARCAIGRIKSKLPQMGDASHSLRAKRTELLEGVRYDVSALPEADLKELATNTALCKAAERILAAK